MKVSIRLYISGDCAATVAPVLRKTNSKLQSPVFSCVECKAATQSYRTAMSDAAVDV